MTEDKKNGTFLGVFVPNVTMMFGVILFLRIGVIVGSAGLTTTIAIVVLSSVIMLLTSASVATLATNMKVKDGGVYYLITRSLGIEAGGALGFVLYINQLLCAAMTISAFAYTIAEIFPVINVSILEVITLLLLAGLSNFSSKAALKVQFFVLIVLMISIIGIFFGSVDNINLDEIKPPFFEKGTLSFWKGFSVFYVALTGIEAGMALSGKLKNPAKSLMLGNATSLLFAISIYLLVILYAYKYIPNNILISDPFIFIKYSHLGWLVIFGICVATLSSALGSLLAAPRILQSMAKDKLLPQIFAKEYGAYGEPRWGLFVTTVIILIVTLYTSVGLIIPLYSMVCLMSYGLLNFAAGISSLIDAPSWKPRFYFPYWISLCGSLLCFIGMFMIEAGWSFIAISVFVLFYFVLYKKTIHTRFQDAKDSMLFYLARYILYKLDHNYREHIHTWHPNLLVLAVSPTQKESLIYLATAISNSSGLLTIAAITPMDWNVPERIADNTRALKSFFHSKNIDCLVAVQPAISAYTGYINLVASYGFDVLRVNSVIIQIAKFEDISNECLDLVRACSVQQKDLLIYMSTPRSSASFIEQNLNLWWNLEDGENIEVITRYASVLQGSKKYNDSDATIHTIVTNEGLGSIENFINKFIYDNRLNMNTKFYIKNEDMNNYEYIMSNTTEDSLTILQLKPYSDLLNNEEYHMYLKNIIQTLSNLKGDCLLISQYYKI
jgi:amino acid transporter